MAVAADYLRQNTRMTIPQIQSAILPRTAGGTDVSDWRNWEHSSSRYYPNTHSDTGVDIIYDAVDPRPNGFGTIDVVVNAHQRIRRCDSKRTKNNAGRIIRII